MDAQKMDPSLVPINIPPDDRYAMTTTNASVGSGPGSVEDGGGGGGAGSSMHTGTDGSNLPARNVVACSHCRSQKIKCFPSESQDKPCRRCEKYELSCEYLQHRRGRKKKSKTDADSANGSPAKSFKHDTSAGSGHHSHSHSHHQHQHHPPIASQDFARIPTGSGSDELYRSLTGIGGGGGAARPDLHRNPYRMSEGGGGGYGQVYPTMMENRYNMPLSSHSGSFDSSSGSTFPRLNPLQGIHGYPSLQVGSGGSSTSTPISADRQTAHDVGIGMGMKRAYNTPFALPGLHSSSVAESRIPPHMEQIAGSSQGLIQLPLPPSMHPQDHSATGAGYGGRVTPMVSLLNDNKPTAIDAGSALPPPPIDPGQPGTGASPAAGTDSPGHGSTSSSRAHGGGLAPRADASSTSTGSNAGGAASGGNPTRGSSPPIRPIEIRRFPFLSPAIGGESSAVVGGRARSGLTPASLPNILNLATPASTSGGSGSSERSKGNTELSMGDRLGGSAGLSSPNTSKHQPSKFSSLHHMVADVPPEDESEYEEYEDDADDASSGDEASARTTRTTTINLSASAAAGAGAGGAPVGGIPMQEYSMERKRKRRKLDPGGASGGAGGMEEEDDSARLFREDPVSVGYVTEHQARELFAIFISELNTALPLLDPVIHTFDFVRDTSPFLLSTTLCVASRFLRGGPETTPELVTSIPPEKARAVHESCLRLARQQMQLTFQHAVSTLEIVQAITLLSIWKEPDDDKAGFYFNRAVVMAKELHLGRIERSRPRTADEAHWRRIRHRVWLGLFIINTIFAMQFNQILQITHEDPLVANSFDWHIGSNLPLVDLSLIASVQLRARFLHYKSLLEITAADADDLERTDQSHTATLLSLSILTRTSNQDLGNINAHWVEQIREASVTGDIPIKPFIWLAGLRLHLNIVIMNQTIRIENSRRLQRNSLGSIAAFHHSINAACEVLTKMKMLPKRQLAFASDTLLHFTIYAGYFLFTVCTKSTRDLLEPEERQHCEDIVIEASQALANASLYPADAPALHARFLRRLTSPYLPPQDTLDSANGTRATRGNSDNDVDSRDLQQQAPPHVHHQPDYNTLPPDYNNAALANGFQFAQESGLPSNIPLADTIWGGTDDGLWTQFDGAWWDHVMQDMTAKNAAKPMSSINNLQPPT